MAISLPEEHVWREFDTNDGMSWGWSCVYCGAEFCVSFEPDGSHEISFEPRSARFFILQPRGRSISQLAVEIERFDADSPGPAIPSEELKCKALQERAVDDPLAAVDIIGWWAPEGKGQPGHKCVIEGCTKDAIHHLCEDHSLPGLLMDIEDTHFVISYWLVECHGQMQILPLNDFALGEFGPKDIFEQWLGQQGYTVHRSISSAEELDSARKRWPVIVWERA